MVKNPPRRTRSEREVIDDILKPVRSERAELLRMMLKRESVESQTQGTSSLGIFVVFIVCDVENFRTMCSDSSEAIILA